MPEVAKIQASAQGGNSRKQRRPERWVGQCPYGEGGRLAHLFKESLPSRSDREQSPREKRRHLISGGHGEASLSQLLRLNHENDETSLTLQMQLSNSTASLCWHGNTVCILIPLYPRFPSN